MDPKSSFLQALLRNHHAQKTAGSEAVALFGLSWTLAPAGFSCPRCEGPLEKLTGVVMMSPWAGSVRCTLCPYRNSVVRYLGEKIFRVEPLPEGSLPLYVRVPPPEEE